jgi:predicted aspartyl protease
MMGRTIVTIELSNYADILDAERGRMTPDKIRRVALPAVVDTGAARLVLPASVAGHLGLPVTGQCTVRYADHRRELRDTVKDAHVQLAGRGSVFTAILEPNRTDALLGAIVMEELDLLVDCTGQKVIPRDSDRIFAEIE